MLISAYQLLYLILVKFLPISPADRAPGQLTFRLLPHSPIICTSQTLFRSLIWSQSIK